jgi:hypothetical protein
LFGVAIGMPESHLNSVGMLCQSGQFNPRRTFTPGGKQRFGIDRHRQAGRTGTDD